MAEQPPVAAKADMTEAEFRHSLRVGNWVQVRRSKCYSIAPHHQYVTANCVYQVTHLAVVESGFCFRTTTDFKHIHTYLSWDDLDPRMPIHG